MKCFVEQKNKEKERKMYYYQFQQNMHEILYEIHLTVSNTHSAI